MNQKELRSRVRKLQSLIDAEMARRGRTANPGESQRRYIDLHTVEDDVLDAEFWETVYQEQPSHEERMAVIRAKMMILITAALVFGIILGSFL